MQETLVRFLGWEDPWKRDRRPTLVLFSFPGGLDGKESAHNVETWVQSLGWEDPLEEGMATHSSILAWRIPWTEKPGGLQSVGSQSQTRLSHSAQHSARF